METQTKNETAELLDRIYKNVKTGAESIVTLMPKVSDEEMRAEMTRELSCLEGFSREIDELLREEGTEPQEQGVFARLCTKMGINMSAMTDSSRAHIAELMMEGYTVGITDMTKDIRECENTTASEASLKLARDIVAFQEKSFSEMKRFLLYKSGKTQGFSRTCYSCSFSFFLASAICFLSDFSSARKLSISAMTSDIFSACVSPPSSCL